MILFNEGNMNKINGQVNERRVTMSETDKDLYQEYSKNPYRSTRQPPSKKKSEHSI